MFYFIKQPTYKHC